MERAKPPVDITPADFFLLWVPGQVANDAERRAKLAETEATVQFDLTGAGGGRFTITISRGEVQGREGSAAEPDLRVELSVDTWRRLNAGEVSAPEAILKRDMRFTGSFLLGLKLHLLLG